MTTKPITPLEDTIAYLKETRTYKAALDNHIEHLQKRRDNATDEIGELVNDLCNNEFDCICGKTLVRETTPTGGRIFVCECGYRIAIDREGMRDEDNQAGEVIE